MPLPVATSSYASMPPLYATSMTTRLYEAAGASGALRALLASGALRASAALCVPVHVDNKHSYKR
jgi:hypothetical protein